MWWRFASHQKICYIRFVYKFFCLHFLKFSLQRISEFDLVVVDGSQSFEGTGASKKLAKQACARYVLISHKKYTV